MALAASLVCAPSAVAAAASQSVRLEGRAFGLELSIEVLAPPGPTVEDALQDAAAAVALVEALADGEGERADGVGALNRSAGSDFIVIHPSLYLLLERTLSLCHWSAGAHGPLGGNLYALWGLRRTVGGLPSSAALVQQVERAGCENLQLDSRAVRATLAEGSRLELWGLAEGFAVDAAVERLLDAGLRDGWVQLGRINRAFGRGPSGEGWPILASAGSAEMTERVLLVDRALAAVAANDRPLVIAGEVLPPYLDQRTGRPRLGTVAVLAAAERAADAHALAVALFVMPNREGEFRLAGLRATAAAIWFLGSADGRPLITQYRWSILPKWSPPPQPGRP